MVTKSTNSIRAARQQKGLTQQALAEAVGVKKATVSGWECGEYEPSPRTAIALTRLLPGLKFEHIYPQGRAAA